MAGKPKAPKLTLKQKRFVEAYARHGNGTQAASDAGYKGNRNTLHVVASENLRKPTVAKAFQGELAQQAIDFSPNRVKRRLDEIGREAQQNGQYGPAVRAEELIGKAAGMWIDQSLNLSGHLSDSHVAALLEHARTRQAEPVDNRDSDDDDE